MPLFTGFSAVVISEEVTLWSSTFLSFMLVPAIFLPTWLIQVHFVLLDYCFFFSLCFKMNVAKSAKMLELHSTV